VRVKVPLEKRHGEAMDKGAVNPLEHVGGGLFEEEKKGLGDVKVDKS
jgi:hypothetical protein